MVSTGMNKVSDPKIPASMTSELNIAGDTLRELNGKLVEQLQISNSILRNIQFSGNDNTRTV